MTTEPPNVSWHPQIVATLSRQLHNLLANNEIASILIENAGDVPEGLRGLRSTATIPPVTRFKIACTLEGEWPLLKAELTQPGFFAAFVALGPVVKAMARLIQAGILVLLEFDRARLTPPRALRE